MKKLLSEINRFGATYSNTSSQSSLSSADIAILSRGGSLETGLAER
jgi:hypothetical protein